jgi:hypothetical protein
MRTSASSSLLFFLSVALANSASAVERIDGPQLPPSANKVLRLSNEECEAAGGSVNDSVICNSKLVCQTTDQNGTIHRVCISKPVQK